LAASESLLVVLHEIPLSGELLLGSLSTVLI